MRPAASAILLTILCLQLLTGCSSRSGNANSSDQPANKSQANSNAAPKDNVEELGMIVHLPFEPEDVAWEEDPAGKKLTAVLRFSPENAAKMAAEIAKNGTPSNEEVTVESWYPAELIAQGELTGESTIRGRSFAAEPFLNPPYTKGKIIHVDNTDYFILQISS